MNADTGPASPGTIYRIRNLSFFYGAAVVLDLPSLDIPRGRIVSLLGPNGSGKTTLLKLLAGLLPPVRGSIGMVEAAAQQDPQGGSRAGRRAVYVHQNPLLLGGTVFDNVAYGLKLRRRLSRAEIAERVDRSLAAVGLADFARRRARRLSGGESQRVAVARALALDPEVLLLDEPTASVDRDSVELIRRVLIEANRTAGTSILVSSHDLPFAASVSDEVLFLSGGRVTGRLEGKSLEKLGGSLPFTSARNGE